MKAISPAPLFEGRPALPQNPSQHEISPAGLQQSAQQAQYELDVLVQLLVVVLGVIAGQDQLDLLPGSRPPPVHALRVVQIYAQRGFGESD